MVEDLRSWASRDERAIWQEYCGFLDLGISEFMALQEKLLREQLGVLEGSVVGKKFLGERVPSSIEEFQARVPFTRYEDYAPWLMEKREDVLPAPVFCWAHTAGTTDTFKWIPYTRGMYSQQQRRMLSWAIIAASDGYGQVNLSPGDTILYGVAPPPYISGIFYEAFINGFGFNSLPSMQDGSGMEFPERVRVGLLKGLEAGIDIFAGLSSVLVKVGESFSQRGMGLRGVLLRPKLLYKLFRAKLKSKFQNRELLPRDLWRLKSIGSYGMDTFIYRNRIEYFWGRKPTETYISTESGMISLQTWNHKGLIFLPDSVFLEFIPEEEFNKNAADPSWHPEAFCLSEVEPGARYEVVITNFHGGCLIRYRMGDFIRILSAQEREEGIPCPQMVFEARCDEIIDIAGFTRLTERVIWQSLED
ncbi:MAG: GH3 auxin-responsive promoter family protein, partial [Nitrospinota bacterium]